MSNFAIMVCCMWISATIATLFTKKAEPFEFALVGTVAIGIGKLIVGGH